MYVGKFRFRKPQQRLSRIAFICKMNGYDVEVRKGGKEVATLPFALNASPGRTSGN